MAGERVIISSRILKPEGCKSTVLIAERCTAKNPLIGSEQRRIRKGNSALDKYAAARDPNLRTEFASPFASPSPIYRDATTRSLVTAASSSWGTVSGGCCKSQIGRAHV